MFAAAGKFFSEEFKRWFPDSFVFALILTILTMVTAIFWVDATPMQAIGGWYDGFWLMLEFGMQMTLILATGIAIAISPPARKVIDFIAKYIKTPTAVYLTVIVVGNVLVLFSWSWNVLAAVLGRELAQRVKGVDYAYLIACTYICGAPWVSGMSSSIPLLLNTEGNFLIEAGLLPGIIPLSDTLLSPLNATMLTLSVVLTPIVMFILRPKPEDAVTMEDLRYEHETPNPTTVAQEADAGMLDKPAVSDKLNNSVVLQYIIVILGLVWIVNFFATRGLDLNLYIMIFTFLIIGMAAHLKPIRYVVAMKRSCSNISGIVFQYPFYAGIMGIMIYTGLGKAIAGWMAQFVTVDMLPFMAWILGGAVNFSIPSAGGEWAVIGPPLVEAANTLGAHMSPDELRAYHARLAMGVAYGESLTNLVQPFFLLVIMPVMGVGVKVQARDVMGYVFIPFLFFSFIQGMTMIFFPL